LGFVRGALSFGTESGRDLDMEELVEPPKVMLARIGTMVGGLVCVVLGAVVVLSFQQYSSRTQRFVVGDFQVTGNHRVADNAIIDASGVLAGSPLLAVNAARVRARLEAMPWVHRASVHPVLPSRLVLQVQEYEPVAVVIGETMRLVDGGGRLFKSVEAGERHDLTMLTGLRTDTLGVELEDGSVVSESPLQRRHLNAALTLLEHYGQSTLVKEFPLSEVHWDPAQGTTLVSSIDGAELRIGDRTVDELPQLLVRVRRLLEHVEASKQRLRYAFLDDASRPDRVVLRTVGRARHPIAPKGSRYVPKGTLSVHPTTADPRPMQPGLPRNRDDRKETESTLQSPATSTSTTTREPKLDS
jgi:cell division protein FtsQ